MEKEVNHMSELPIAPVKRLMKSVGSYRVSNDAVVYLNEVLEEEGTKIAKKAGKLASHAGRQTISVADVKLALRDD